ncbi:ATP-dependent ABC transporter [Ascoidea rubescens DSM 1968]|uniref:ATP-dependent ABC transporter n=1 Tax=Ascoidea rubescens DSM 1968 TaxID=1344418 RepID=A0A1D2VHG9_9ASCO|nr:ATP-dependent ABC transporter [Ascoidea rubescens DSM 1968]ODV60927.1 ATP-dependent ABC transporter [Ascoidea rubescens DSM 1968]
MNGFLVIPESERVSLTVRNLKVSVLSAKSHSNNTNSENVILDDISLDLKSGEVMAILGGSGSGKTTLLNILSQRYNRNKNFHCQGMIKYNDFISIGNVKSAYLLQTDLFLPGLTVKETLNYAAELKLFSVPSKTEKFKFVDFLLDELNLNSIKDTKFSTFNLLSGGEQRRISLAIQLLNDPSILFLDEPTTGLDSFTSFNLIQTIKNLSQKFGITIILSIHQPRTEILSLFDKICLLAKGGKLCYFGDPNQSLNYFNFNCNLAELKNIKNFNLADSIIDLVAKDTTSKQNESNSLERIDYLSECWKSYQTNQLIELDNDEIFNTFQAADKISQKPQSISLLKEVEILTRRTFLLSTRDSYSLFSLIFGILLISIVVGWLFYDPYLDLSGIRTNIGALYSICETVALIPMLFEMARLWDCDGKFFFRENADKSSTVSGFLISRRLAKFFIEDLPIAIIFSVTTYFMWGFDTNNKMFLVYFSITLLSQLIGMSSAMFCFAAADSFQITAIIWSIFYFVQNFACGYYVNPRTMPVYVRWVRYICTYWYVFGANVSNRFTGFFGECPQNDINSTLCNEYIGKFILNDIGFPENWISLPLSILVAWFLGFYFVAAILLKYKNKNVSFSKSKKNNDNKDQVQIHNNNVQTGTADSILESNLSNLDINIHIKNISLFVTKKSKFKFIRKFLGQNTDPEEKTLIENVSAFFEQGKINAIMGPSGSGKSTLLNLISNRIENVRSTGSIYLNEDQIPLSYFHNYISYTTQNDASLIPTLTVWETLCFQARLRLPVKEHSNIFPIVSELINKMGLNDCKNILVGDENIKGISGGEKRRTSIAIQLLDNSRILVLDEPTSGLDSFTSSTILKLLADIAQGEKKIVIITIHQPKYELFSLFGNVLLLCKGGKVAFNGAQSKLSGYFEKLGYMCSENTNFADYILDLVSESSKDVDSKIRVENLLINWKNNYGKTEEFKEKTFENPMVDESEFETEKYKILKKKKAAFGVALVTLIERQAKTIFRSKDIILNRLGQVLTMGVFGTIFYAPLSNSSDGIYNRLGLIQNAINLYYYGFLNNIAVYPIERDYYYVESKDNLYRMECFLVAYLINEIPFEIITSLLFSALYVFGVGLPRNAEMFLVMFYGGFVTLNAGESIGIMFNTIFSNFGIAMNGLSTLFTIAIFMGGTMSMQMPMFFQVWNYLNPLKYVVKAVSNMAFRNQEFECVGGIDECSLNSGEAVLEYYRMKSPVAINLIALLIILISYRTLAYLFLHIKMKTW